MLEKLEGHASIERVHQMSRAILRAYIREAEKGITAFTVAELTALREVLDFEPRPYGVEVQFCLMYLEKFGLVKMHDWHIALIVPLEEARRWHAAYPTRESLDFAETTLSSEVYCDYRLWLEELPKRGLHQLGKSNVCIGEPAPFSIANIPDHQYGQQGTAAVYAPSQMSLIIAVNHPSPKEIQEFRTNPYPFRFLSTVAGAMVIMTRPVSTWPWQMFAFNWWRQRDQRMPEEDMPMVVMLVDAIEKTMVAMRRRILNPNTDRSFRATIRRMATADPPGNIARADAWIERMKRAPIDDMIRLSSDDADPVVGETVPFLDLAPGHGAYLALIRKSKLFGPS